MEIKTALKKKDGMIYFTALTSEEEFNKIVNPTKEKAAGIVSYLASPLDVREKYKLESGIDISAITNIDNYANINRFLIYADWLEGLVVELAAR